MDDNVDHAPDLYTCVEVDSIVGVMQWMEQTIQVRPQGERVRPLEQMSPKRRY